MPRRQRYLGRGQIAVCMRSGIKCHASELVRDGRIPSLLVLPEWADPPQPQEQPYVPNDLEGAPRFPVSPDVTPTTPPILSAEDVIITAPDPPVLSVESEQPGILVWTEAVPSQYDTISGYELYRSVNGAAFSLLAETASDVLTYTDEEVAEGNVYEYYVVGIGEIAGPSVDSNTVEINLVVGFETALASSSVNGTNFTAPAAWAFGTSDFTCEFWFMSDGDTVDNGQFRVLRARSLSGAQNGWEVQVRSAGVVTEKTMRLLLRPSGSSFTFDSSTVLVNDGVWAHYAFVVDRNAQTVTFYVNGASVGSTSIAAAGSGNFGFSGTMSIMQAIGGAVDELRVWTVARTPQEIADNYETPFGDPQAVADLIADWQFNEGSGTDTNDSVQGTAATIVSGGTFVAGPTP